MSDLKLKCPDVKPGDLVTLRIDEHESIVLTARLGNALDDTDNRPITRLERGNVGLVLAKVDGDCGEELMVMVNGAFGWNMSHWFSRLE